MRRRTFAHVFVVDSERGPATLLVFRSTGDELDVLLRVGHPFFKVRSSGNALGMVLDGADWDEVAELVTESYCVLAPKALVSVVRQAQDSLG